MRKANFLKVLENNQRRSSVHLDMETPTEQPVQHQRKDNELINLDDNNTPTTEEKKRKRTGVICPFTAFYGIKSPKTKKKKRNDEEKIKMKTFENPTDDPTYEAETLALSGITQNIEDELVNELIEKFSPVIRIFPEQIMKEMLECSKDWINRKEIFIGAINYVMHGRKDVQNMVLEQSEMCIEKLSESLVREIENRMPKYCRKCQQHYIVKFNDCPEIHCMWCKVGMHDCTTMNEMKDRAGIKWLCETCEPIFNTHYLPKLDPIAIFEGFNLHIPTKQSTVTSVEKDEEVEVIQVETPTQTTPAVEIVDNQTTPAVEIVDNPPPSIAQQIDTQPNASEVAVNNISQNNISQNNISQNSVSQNNTNQNDITGTTQAVIPPPDQALNINYKDVKKFPNMNKNKICNFLTKGICRYGAKGENQLGQCNKYHPNQCSKYNLHGTRDLGCKNGSRCNEWHATYICRNSANSNSCTRPECPFKHHRGCTVNEHDNFFVNQSPYTMPRQYQGRGAPTSYHRQPQHQHQHQHQRWYGPSANQRQPYQSQPYQFHGHQHFPADHLAHMIRTILREENSHQYQARR